MGTLENFVRLPVLSGESNTNYLFLRLFSKALRFIKTKRDEKKNDCLIYRFSSLMDKYIVLIYSKIILIII